MGGSVGFYAYGGLHLLAGIFVIARGARNGLDRYLVARSNAREKMLE